MVLLIDGEAVGESANVYEILSRCFVAGSRAVGAAMEHSV